ncbi:MAG: cobalt ECF transporter T component CbiQ [Lachnospiraceae bacterium]|nr:cobalt ECF transporter T component CbiQ [Lachnospiraceae bacterium]
MIIIDKLCYNSKLRYVNAETKCAFSILTLIFCIADRSIVLSLLVLGIMGYVTVCRGGIPFSRYLYLMRLPLIFLFLSTLAIIANFSKTPMDAFAIPIGGIYITSTKASLLRAAQLILTALASVSCLYFLSLSTPITDILSVFKRIHCPDLLIELMLLIYRFIFVLFDIADSLSTAQHSRLGNVNFKTSCQSFGSLASALFVRSFKKSNILYDAMESRCYDGKLRVLNESFTYKKRHIIYIIALEAALISISILLRSFGIHY